MECDVSKWKEFRVGDIFNVLNGKGLTIEEINENHGNIPCIQGGAINNGFIGLVSKNYIQSRSYILIKTPCLTVARVGTAGYVNYWDIPCAIGDKCKALLLKMHTSKFIYLFMQTALNQMQYKYSYGRGLITEKYMNEIIKLPADSNGEPDWLFMENYIKLLHYKPLTTENKPGQAPDLNVKKWKKFALIDLFNEVKIAKSADISNLEDGNIPFVGRTDIDNGIQGFVSPVAVTKGHCITISMVGTNVALYQENDFQASQNIAVLRKSDITKNMALFICSVINFEMQLKYSYGRTVGKTNIKSMTLNLPADLQGKPDWLFMENYIKSLPY